MVAWVVVVARTLCSFTNKREIIMRKQLTEEQYKQAIADGIALFLEKQKNQLQRRIGDGLISLLKKAIITMLIVVIFHFFLHSKYQAIADWLSNNIG